MHQFFQEYPLESFFIAYYLTLNLISFWLYGWDKAAARAKKTRIAEKTLHGYTFAGGAIGALVAQSFFRHKTQKGFFKWFAWFCFGLHVALLFLLFGSTGIFSD
ncbi:DUF1294 domain-containing protein [Undibacterium sp.]|uniref:DUF1294 domain-containing protein n=1 Tax=Undibacterium sp. TaxID=1914977 RepID=UPI003752B41F